MSHVTIIYYDYDGLAQCSGPQGPTRVMIWGGTQSVGNKHFLGSWAKDQWYPIPTSWKAMVTTLMQLGSWCMNHVLILLTWFTLLCYGLSVLPHMGHQYPYKRALFSRLRHVKWFLYVSLWISSRMASLLLLVIYRNNCLDSCVLLYNLLSPFKSSNNLNCNAILSTFPLSFQSVDKIWLIKYST